MNAEGARKINIIRYLNSIEIEAKRQKGSSLFYNSPFRSENNPSFKVDTEKNVWYDHGNGKGGSIIDLVMLLENISFKEALSQISLLSGSPLPSFSFHCQNSISDNLKIKHVQQLQNKALIQYLQSRKIPFHIARNYLKEAYYSVSDKNYFALAFENDKGGFELRNKYFKGAASPKYYTTIQGTKNTSLNLFEGIFDFLAALQFFNTERTVNTNIILNSTANIQKILPKLNKYESVFLFLDNDKSGTETAAFIQTQCPNAKNRGQKIYPKHKDFNDFITKFGI